MREMCDSLKQVAYMSGEIEHMELLLTPLREYVLRWAAMIGDTHSGGLLTAAAELPILASITGTAIEVFGSSLPDRSEVPHYIKVCETGRNDIVSNFERRSLFLPVKTCVPSLNEDFRLFSILQDTSHLWMGPYPVIRLVLDGQHYEACTSPIAYRISPDTQGHSSGISGMWFSTTDTLTEPFAILKRCEEERVVRMEQIFDDIPQSAPSNVCREDTMSPYID